MAEHLDPPIWWAAVVLSSVAVAIAVSICVPTAITSLYRKQKEEKKPLPAKAKSPSKRPSKSISEEPWCPKLELQHWSKASQLPGCPWNFDGCDSVEDVLERIWRTPLAKELVSGYEVLRTRTVDIHVGRVSLGYVDEVHFAVVYRLKSGAEVFGGQPLEHAVGLELDAPSSVPQGGLRRRRGGSAEPGTEAEPDPLACLSSFFRIHDGFGALTSSRHLPLVFATPCESVNGSCFYVYPAREVQPVDSFPHPLLKFARVDHLCDACIDPEEEQPRVIFVEKRGEQVPDDDMPLAFIADTISNLCGHRVVPPAYMCNFSKPEGVA